jgi:hypothetical protein
MPMTITFKKTIPIDPKHGATVGRTFDVTKVTNAGMRDRKYWFMGDAHEECAAFAHEVEVKGPEASA